MTLQDDIRRAVTRWELLRIPFNLVLLTLGLPVAFLADEVFTLPTAAIVEMCVFVALAANAFYLLGPTVELYLLAYGRRVGNWRYVLFGLGILFSVALFLYAWLWLVVLSDSIGPNAD